MIKFGKPDEFEIWVDYYFIKYKGNEDFIAQFNEYEMWAFVYFWVNGKNIFAFKDCGADATYGFDLNVLVTLFTDHLYYHITNDPFPVKTTATNGVDMMEETKLVQGDDSDLSKWAELDWDNIDMSIRREIDLWNYHHGFLDNRGGSFLPDAYVQRVGSQVEISWKNLFPHRNVNGEFYFEHKEGVEFIDLKLYRDTVISFCLDFISKFKNSKPEWMQKYLDDLKRAIEVEV